MDGVDKAFEGKKNHFNIRLKNGKSVHLKHDDDKEALKWTTAIEKLVSVYKGKSLLDFEVGSNWKDQTDIRIVNMIMEELERNFGY